MTLVKTLGSLEATLPLDVRTFGASPTATPAANQTAFTAALAAGASQGRPVYVPATASPFQINDFLTITTVGARIFGDGRRSQIQQTTAGLGCIRVTATDVTVEGLKLTTSAPRTLVGIASDSTDLQPDGTYLSGLFTGVLLNRTSHRCTIRNVLVVGMMAGVCDDGSPPVSGAYMDGLVVNDFESGNCCFGIVGGGWRDARITNVRGTYSLMPGIGKPPHLIYVATNSVSVYSRNLQMSNIEAWDGATGAAVKVAGVIGGSVQGVSARNTRGVLDLLALTDVNFSNIVSIDDNGSAVDPGPVKASIMLEDCTRVAVRGGKVVFANIDHAEGLQTTTGSTDCVLENIEVTTNFLVAGQTNENQTCVRVYGTRNSYRNIAITNVGADRGSGFLVAATGTRIVDPIIRNNIHYGFYQRATSVGTTIDYDPSQVVLTYGGATEQFLEAGATAPTMQVRGTTRPFTFPGQYFFTTSPGGVSSSATLGVGTMRLVPWLLERTITIDRLGVEVLTAGEAGSLFRILIYADDGSSFPKSLVVDAGTVAGDTTGSKEAVVNLTLIPGVYWVGGAVQNVVTTQPTMRTVLNTAYIPPVPLRQGTAMPTAGQTIIGLSSSTTVTGAAPASFPGANGSGSAVRVFARRSA